ncbi:2-oxoglutarate dehydrogenase complex dihydrolipoyllysine-residue succinyltransferase [Thiohalophilus thiocyanatoxydans]|uniref:Dihydrolipoyllysine-residue succinyltransferase component of 2-oxoglutarate dehydrogenase complex n=1 Tax=Thiohalophilus thiocyanatoxydans TaxID=381308 RepID=A0A4V3H4N8_9GAMM|nr:2-oxoglutarate dehydrogenase complex dihydrolipoyllysine-residue succinyltransferase [Thiohalophilus thiocyanatoxydans]TDY03915.1 2-oxoglutarate dehydrogenase E2 component [Thiohalophilus thiocyanatoxydans]
MAIDIKVAQFPESVSEGTLIEWHKQPGETVRQDELLAEIETDKVVFEVNAPEDGVLDDLLVQQGDTVSSEQVIARMQPGDVPASATREPAATPTDTETTATSDDTPRLAPAAKKLIAEHDLDANLIKGTGKDGRILKEDVQAYLDQADKPGTTEPSRQPGSASAPPSTGEDETQGERPQKRVPMSRLRARIAERLVEAQQTAAILTTFNEIDMQPVMDLRARYKEKFEKQHGVKLGFMSFFIKACLEALQRFPEINASIDGEEIIYHGFYDIGIAVGSPRGLVVPILRDADTLSMAAIEKQIADYAERAQTGKLSLDEITGGTFSITNGGIFGSLLSTPILNPPQSAILGMHKIEKRPVVIDDEIVIRPMMYVALSYDHRLVDGREAVQFLMTIKEGVEDPARMLLNV